MGRRRSCSPGGRSRRVAAIVLTFTPVAGKHAIGYTELWMQPLRGAEPALRVGVGSEEQTRTRYELVARFGDGSERRTPIFALDPGATKLVRWAVVRAPGSPPLRVSVSLFRQDRPARPYRRVFGWIPSPSTPR